MHKTPGVYIVEEDAFPNSVVEVASAVPAFVGYTAKALHEDRSLKNMPWRITSRAEFESVFGGAPDLSEAFSLSVAGEGVEPVDPGASLELTRQTRAYHLYSSMRLFFANGGGPCYVVSVGGYDDPIEKTALIGGINTLEHEPEPTLLVIPDAVLLDVEGECAEVQQHALRHCGTSQSRFAILDVANGFRARDEGPRDCITDFRDGLGSDHLQWAAAYYPWVDTTVTDSPDVSFDCFDKKGRSVLADLMRRESEPDLVEPATEAAQQTHATWSEQVAPLLDSLAGVDADGEEVTPDDNSVLHNTLKAISPAYNDVLKSVLERLNRLPPSGALAGVYTAVDNARGVWKAPANVSLGAVIKPTVNVTHEQQEDLNVTPQRKSVNAIRTFVGEGTLVWGGRTLDGNSLDWRYVSVRRTMIMIEQSIKLAIKAYVFEPNDANTWATIKSMIRNFLVGLWKRGGLAGATPDDALSVSVGLGATMTPEDIADGVLRVTVMVAPTRPAEFIVITLTQQMQKS